MCALSWAVLTLAGSTAAELSRFEWKQGADQYYGVERGHLLKFVEVSIVETSEPFNERAEILLLEPCGSAVRVAPDAPPCWPHQEGERTQELLASLFSNAPDYREKLTLLRLASYLNRDIGTFRRAWIIGTNPLAVAFLDGPPDQIPPDVQRRLNQVRELTGGPGARASTRPTTRPGYVEIVTRSGEVVPVDLRVRDAQFVTGADLDTRVDRILLYPQDMPLLDAGQRPAPGTDAPHRVKVFQLPEPVSIESVMRALTEPGKLEREAKLVAEAPVVIHPCIPEGLMSWLITSILVMTSSIAQAPEQPATAPVDPYSEYAIAALRVFRTQAMIYATPMRIYATEARRIDEKDRTELLKLLDDYKRTVNDEVKKLRANLPRPNDIYNRAEELGQEFERRVLQPWLEAHPDAKGALDQQQLIYQLMIDDLLQGGKEVVAAAQRAGLDPGAQNLAKSIVQEAFDGFQEYARGIATWQEVAARVPKDSAQYLESTLIMANTELFKLETAQKVRQKLRELIPAERHRQFDDELAKLGGG